MTGCLFQLMDVLVIRAWVAIFWWAISTLKYMGMCVLAIFMGPIKTVNRLAESNTVRQTGLPVEQTPRLFAVERAKVILWMLWGYAFWGWLIYLVVVAELS